MDVKTKPVNMDGKHEVLKANKLKIVFTKVFVDDQDKALKFYTDTLGFVKKNDVIRDQYRWLTVTSADNENGAELILELNTNPAAKKYQKAIYEQSVPAANFEVPDVHAVSKRLKERGVTFTVEPTEVMKNVVIAIFDDTCGNLIQIQQVGEQ